MSKSAQQTKRVCRGVIGIDEVGRGPLAGPVTLCACYLEDEKTILKEIFANTIRDSKKLTKQLRNNIYQTISNKRYLHTKIKYAVSSRTAAYIDKHGISKAMRQCLLSCVRSLESQGVAVKNVSIQLDAGLTIPLEGLKQKSFVKGDEKFVEIALASIIAKVTRDTYMEKLAKKFPQYAWEKNVGYATKEHRESLKKLGPTKYHRLSYLKAFKQFEKTE